MMNKRKPVTKEFKTAKNITILLCLIVFIISLTQVAFKITDFDGSAEMPSYQLFLVGSIAFLGGGLIETMIWLVNPISLIAILYFLKADEICKVFSIAALLLSLTYIFWKKILIAENGRMADINSLCLGYWLWISSVVILNFGIFYSFKQLKKTKTSTD